MELWGLAESTFKENQSRRTPAPKGTAEEWTDFSLARRLWQGPVQLTQHLISKRLRNGEGSEMGCTMQSRLKESGEARRMDAKHQDEIDEEWM